MIPQRDTLNPPRSNRSARVPKPATRTADVPTATLCSLLTSATFDSLNTEWLHNLSWPSLTALDTAGAAHHPPPTLRTPFYLLLSIGYNHTALHARLNPVEAVRGLALS